MAGERWRLGHRPALDGLRGVAILLVVVSHTLIGTGVFQLGGAVGVDLFFALSGYLITGLLIPDASLGRIDAAGFYLRRARRLFPAAYVVLVGTAALLWVARDPYLVVYPREALSAVIYCRNLYMFPRGAGFDGALGHMWSLAVEEQFYVAWPLVLLGVFAVSRRLRISPIAPVVVLVGVAAGWRVVVTLTATDSLVVHRLDVSAVALLAGALVAVAESTGRTLVSRWASLVGLGVVLVAAGLPLQAGLRPVMWAGLVVAGASALTVTRGTDAIGLLHHPWLRGAGRISYGWYLWHVPLMSVWIGGHQPGSGQRVLASVAGLGLAVLSYRYVEQPLLARRSPLLLEVDHRDIQVRVGAGIQGDRAAGEPA